ncbi:hypothetical protein ACLB2K_001464 [Fragaria x ananassa]
MRIGLMRSVRFGTQPRRGERELIGTEFTMRDWKLSRMLKQSGLEFNEGQVLKGLGVKKCWKQALTVVEWVYKDRGNNHCKSRFVYTKLLSILQKAGMPQEALDIFNKMCGDCHIYPDIAAYHSIVVTLGQTGRLKELLKVIECMRQKPVKINRYIFRNWDPVLEPDVVVYNAILNACVQSHQWKSVYWVFNQLRKSGLKPNGATHGLAMEYDLGHELLEKWKGVEKLQKLLPIKLLFELYGVKEK